MRHYWNERIDWREYRLHVVRSKHLFWFYKPQWYWFGWKTLWPFQIGHDEYARRTLMLGWTVTGRAIITLGDCGDPECKAEAIQDLKDELI